MTRRRWHRALSVACLCMMAACSRSVDFERMRQQARVDPYGSSALFSDRMAMRRPPSGTVPIAGDDGSSADTMRGHDQYEVFCAVCHGHDGSGQSVMASNLPGEPSLSLVGTGAAQLDAVEMFDVISHGKGRMPGFDWALTSGDRHAVVAYVQSLQQRAAAVTGPESGR